MLENRTAKVNEGSRNTLTIQAFGGCAGSLIVHCGCQRPQGPGLAVSDRYISVSSASLPIPDLGAELEEGCQKPSSSLEDGVRN